MPGYGKYRSPEEKEEFVKQLGADAKQRVIDLAENWEADAKDVAEFLIFSSRFPDYSVRNQMLIYKQNPYAMFTAGYNQFEKMGYWRRKNGAVYPYAGRQQFPFSGIGAHHTAFSAYDGTGRCTQHRQLTRAGAFCARGSAKYYVAGQLPKLGCDDAFAQHHIIDYSAKYIADQAYVPGRLGVRVRHVR